MDTHKENNNILIEELVLSLFINKYRPKFFSYCIYLLAHMDGDLSHTVK
jgi:hypothetical protein